MTFEEAIKSYLDNYAKDSVEFAAKYSQKNKSIDNCLKYITEQARAKQQKGCAVLSDDEVYQLARHYYEESDENLNFKPSTSNENTSKVRVEVKKEKTPVKPIKEKNPIQEKKKELEQLDIFGFLGA